MPNTCPSSKCGAPVAPANAFCPSCGIKIPRKTITLLKPPERVIEIESDDVEYDAQIEREVHAVKEKQRLKDRTSNTPSTPSAFGIDPNSSVGIEPRAVELWTSIAGESPVKQNNGYKVWPLNPRQSIEPDLDTFIRKFARGI